MQKHTKLLEIRGMNREQWINPIDLKVIITHNSRSAISEIFGFIQDNYVHQFKDSLPINYETSSFKSIRSKFTLPQGWNGTINANPELLLKRGYDKVIYVQRDLVRLCEAMAKYHRKCFTIKDYIRLALSEPNFCKNIERNYDKLNKEIDDPRFLKITLFDWNCHTKQTYHELLDFLEFPKDNRMQVIPVRLYENERDFDGYSCSHLDKDHKMCGQIEVIREHV